MQRSIDLREAEGEDDADAVGGAAGVIRTVLEDL